MILSELFVNIISGQLFSELDSYQQYAVMVACTSVVVMVIEKVFGLFAIALSTLKRG